MLHSKGAANNYYFVLNNTMNMTHICNCIGCLAMEMPDGLNSLKYCTLKETNIKIYHYKAFNCLLNVMLNYGMHRHVLNVYMLYKIIIGLQIY